MKRATHEEFTGTVVNHFATCVERHEREAELLQRLGVDLTDEELQKQPIFVCVCGERASIAELNDLLEV